jgi:hypothetical protein
MQLSDTSSSARALRRRAFSAYASGSKIWHRAAVADPATFLLNSVQQRTGAALVLFCMRALDRDPTSIVPRNATPLHISALRLGAPALAVDFMAF